MSKAKRQEHTPEKKGTSRSRSERAARDTAALASHPTGDPRLLGDIRLAHPANAAWRVRSMRALQGQAGNATAQGVLRQINASGRAWDSRTGLAEAVMVQPPLPADTIARSLAAAIAGATRRAGTPSGPWPELTAVQRSQLRDHLQAGRNAQALREMWAALRGRLPLGNRVTVQSTNQLGVVGGTQVAQVSSASAVALIYVPREPACATVAPADHWQQHSRDEIRGILQVNTDLLGGSAEERLTTLNTTLMHEYTHVAQQEARGFFSGHTFVVAGQREFLSEQNIPQAQQRQLDALDEIDAVCSEIENAQRTGLADAYQIRETVSYLWTKYEAYYSSTSGNPERAIARRVYANVQRSRHLLRHYLSSPAGAWVPASTHGTLLRGCPLGYNPSIIEPFR